MSPKTKTLDWPREGGAVKKHAKSHQKHPKCSQACDGWSSLQKGKASIEQKTEHRLDGFREEEDVGPGVYILIKCSDPGLTGENVVFIAEEPPTTTYKLLFVQDKRMKKTAAEVQRARGITWLKTTVDNTRWADFVDNPGANGFVWLNESGKVPKLLNKVNVFIDEWVFVSYVLTS